MKPMSIPFFSLSRQVKQLEKQTLEKFAEILTTQQFIGGPIVENFEKELGKYLGAASVVGCNSGTDALWLALKALDIKKDDIVLTTPFSFIASSSEIVAHEAHPVFIDIDPSTFNICPRKLSAWLHEHATLKDGVTVHKKTGFPVRGIVVVDIFGQCADYQAIKEIADEWKLWIVEDTAQSIGSSYKGKKAGTFGDIGTVSFYPTKNLGAFGDAGCVVTNNEELGEKVRRLKNHGRKSHYNYECLGINSRLDALQAAVLSLKLDSLEDYNNARRAHAQTYKEKLGNIDFITFPEDRDGSHIYHQYAITVETKKGKSLQQELVAHLRENNVGCTIFYEKTLNHIDFLNTHPYLASSCPTAEHISKTVVILPIWPELQAEELDYICSIIKNFAAQQESEKTISTQENVAQANAF